MGPSSSPRGERAGTPGAGWETELRSAGERWLPDGEPEPRANRAARRAAKRSGGRATPDGAAGGPRRALSARLPAEQPAADRESPGPGERRSEPRRTAANPNGAPMPHRHTASTITDDQLDALYGQLERVQRAADILRFANAPDGSPSPLRSAAHVIDIALGHNLNQETAA